MYKYIIILLTLITLTNCENFYLSQETYREFQMNQTFNLKKDDNLYVFLDYSKNEKFMVTHISVYSQGYLFINDVIYKNYKCRNCNKLKIICIDENSCFINLKIINEYYVPDITIYIFILIIFCFLLMKRVAPR